MKKLINIVNDLPLVIKIISLVCVTSIVLLITEYMSRSIVYNAYNEEIYRRTVQTLISYVERIETEIINADTTTTAILSDKSIQSNLIQIRDEKELSRSERNSHIYNTGLVLNGYRFTWEYCGMLSICLSDGRMTNNSELDSEFVHYLVEQARLMDGKMVTEPENGKVWIARQIQQIESGFTLEELGVIIAQLDLDAIVQNLNRSYDKMGVTPEIAIYREEECVYSMIDSEINIQELRECEGWKIQNDQFFIYTTSKETGWGFCIAIPYEQINERIDIADRISTLMTFIVTILVNLICSVLIYSIIKHINRLVKKFDDFKAGKLPDNKEHEKYGNRKDEIGRLHREFDKMAVEYKQMTDDQYNNMMLLKEAQYSQLQRQMQPHFLFNALSTIVWTAYENNDAETAQIADALGEILRLSIDNKKVVAVQEEMKLVEDYICIQKKRYGDRFSMQIMLPEELADVQIPAFTLQPIIENIMVHVVEKTLEHCYIKVTGKIMDETVEIMIEDSGNCLDVDILSKMASGEVKAKGNGVGLSNIDHRIKLLYSDEYGLKLLKSGGFSKVIVKLANRRVGNENAGGENA